MNISENLRESVLCNQLPSLPHCRRSTAPTNVSQGAFPKPASTPAKMSSSVIQPLLAATPNETEEEKVAKPGTEIAAEVFDGG
jgi:hypothetical protein